MSNACISMGNNSTRCQGAGMVTYTATAINTTGITYSLDAASIAGGNTINSIQERNIRRVGWCDKIASAAAVMVQNPSMMTVTHPVGSPVFSLGASSTRCQEQVLLLILLQQPIIRHYL
jgi:hypothetical protein